MASQQRKIHGSVFEGGRFYVEGDEDALHAAELDPKEIARLTREGVISGFGSGKAKGISGEDLEADSTLKAGRADAVLGEDEDEDAGSVGGAMTDTEHTPGLYTGQKGATGPKASGRGSKGKK